MSWFAAVLQSIAMNRVATVVFAWVVLASCGGRVRTTDGAGGQGGAAATTGSTAAGTAGDGAAGGPVTTGGGGASTTTIGTTVGTGGASTTSGSGGASCGTFGACQMTYLGICRAGSVCPCQNCPCQAQACFDDPGCLAIYACAARAGCGTPPDCVPACGDVIRANPGSFQTFAAFLGCTQVTGCGTACDVVVDAGTACAVPAPLGGAMCSSFGDSSGACGHTCRDARMNDYHSKCELVTRTCDCFYNGTRVCGCTASNTQMCADCCPPWPP
jgi:hypothetical protein